MGLICYGCHNFRNKFGAVVKTTKPQDELELEIRKAEELFLKTGKKQEVSRVRIDGYLCKKCTKKAVQVVKDRPFGMGWRQAFAWRDNPKAIQTWKDQRLEMEIGRNDNNTVKV